MCDRKRDSEESVRIYIINEQKLLRKKIRDETMKMELSEEKKLCGQRTEMKHTIRTNMDG